jgi:glycosyltransferase involved in cell wall biosynthesis
MKILLINNQHYRKGGAHTVYFNTGELLQKHGHEIYYFAMKNEYTLPYEYDEFFPNAIDYRELSFLKKTRATKSFIYNKESYKKLNEYIKLIKPDIAHVHLFMGGLTVSILEALKENNIPVVHTVHDYRLICPAYLFLNGENEICEQCKKGKFYWCLVNKCSERSFSQSGILALDAYYREWYKKPYNLMDSLIFVSNFAMQKHQEFELPKDVNCSVLYNFILNLQTYVPNHQRGKYFLYFGRLSREKGILTLIESVRISDIKLKIVGTGPLFEQIKRIETTNIQVLGFKQGDELNQIIRNASFIVIPSEWYENNPMSLIEAYAFGKPVIGADIGGIPEIIIPNETGFLFESKNINDLKEKIQIAQNLTNKEYEYMSKNARKFAETHFNPKNHITALINIYNKLINE